MILKLTSRYCIKSYIKFLMITFIALVSVPMPLSASEILDTSFLKEQPFRKGKQTVDLKSISNAHDLQIIKNAINNIMRLLTILGYNQTNNPGLSSVVTTNGAANLRYPPKSTKSNRMTFHRVANWKIINESELSFDVEFTDSMGKKESYFDHFVFVRTERGWVFDRH